ncbi:MAG: hypothetical protein B7Y36_08050 [Novosphingobium sp. 28-62-57]|nr:MAG: hypothetical protein B7Z36_01140 [Novosphingobium sp. 12-63-9]OYZ10772.1 MAG: hypothetical protein B7Y36_08050 [Novosphingobium sp. 28-62-57]OZA36459.1 MAG: hypothetical protein B7X92_06310 [Novosphingobium sp. 17-62-9]
MLIANRDAGHVASGLITLQLKSGALQIGPPSAFDPFIVRNARANVRPLLAELLADRNAVASLRANLHQIMPGRLDTRDNAALLGLFRDSAESGRLVLVFVPATRQEAPSVPVNFDEEALLHLVLADATILIAPTWGLPGEFRTDLNSARAASALEQLSGNTDAALTLERYADRLGLRYAIQTGVGLRAQLASGLRQGTLQGAVLTDPAKRARAAARKDAPVAVAALATNDKIYAAMRMSRALVRKDVAEALQQLLTPENAAKFVALTAAFIALQYVPVVNVLVNLYVLYELIMMFGSNAIDFAKAAGAGAELASKAMGERALRAAAAKFAEAFEAFGAAGLAIVLARLQVRQTGGAAKQTKDVLVSARPRGAPAGASPKPAPGPTAGKSKPTPPPQSPAPKKPSPQQTELAKLEKLHAAAQQNQKSLANAGNRISEKVGAEFKDPGVKDIGRLKEKFVKENYERASDIKDISRGGFLVKDKAQAQKIVDELGSEFKIVQDKGWKKLDSGYVDRKIIVEYPDGTLGEVQLIPKPIADYKFGQGHHNYDYIRNNPGTEKAADLLKQDKATYQKLLKGSPFD